MDSTKLLTEKLAMGRELSSLRPELDHLRQQTTSNGKLLAEKLSLEHQLGTLQVKLDTEKKSTQRILAREGKARAEDADIGSQVQALQAELSRERREKQKSEREAQQAASLWEAQKMTLGSRLELLKNKERTSKDSLKDAQQELQNARSMAKPKADERAASTYAKTAAANPRKRNATQMLSESIIGTPGDAANERRNKRSSALPGDKSTFSITPYLNRTASVAPESPPAMVPAVNADDPTEASDSAQDDAALNAGESKASAIAEHRSGKAPALGIAKISKTNAKAACRQDKVKAAGKLEKVAEEEQDENGEFPESRSTAVGPTTEDQSMLRGGEAKKKKRKFLGGLSNTLFDEEDREVFKPALGGRAFGSLSKGTLGGPKSRPLLAASSTSGNGFATFSPLKRNIRSSAVGA